MVLSSHALMVDETIFLANIQENKKRYIGDDYSFQY